MLSITKIFWKLSQKVFHNQIMSQEGEGSGIYWNAESTYAGITSSWERLFYSMTPNDIECIWKTLQVTEVYLFMQERKGEPASSYHSVVQRLLQWNPLVLKSTWYLKTTGKGFLKVCSQTDSDLNHSFMALLQI